MGINCFSRFSNLENEVRKRDEIISQLQKRIQELENVDLTATNLTDVREQCPNTDIRNQPSSKNGSSGSDEASVADEGFMVLLSNNEIYIQS